MYQLNIKEMNTLMDELLSYNNILHTIMNTVKQTDESKLYELKRLNNLKLLVFFTL